MISVAVMAHNKRAKWVPGILEKLDAPAKVVWDRVNDRHETGLRAIRAYDPDATHHLIVQDDALLCRDLVAGVARAVEFSGDHPVCLYTGRVKPRPNQVSSFVREAQRTGSPWFEMEGPWWGVGIVLPTKHIPELSDWFERSNVPNYDRRISRWYGQQNLKCWYTVPSLVEHRTVDNPSLTDRPGRRRSAHLFIGEDASALDIDWSDAPPLCGTVVAIQPPATLTFRHARTGVVKVLKADSTEARRHRRHRLWEQLEES